MKITIPITNTRRRPMQVGERAAGQQQRGERQRVGVDHPLQVGEARVQVALDDGSATFTIVMSSSSMNVADADGDEGPPLAIHGSRRYERGSRVDSRA